jgi:hypothetical protein
VDAGSLHRVPFTRRTRARHVCAGGAGAMISSLEDLHQWGGLGISNLNGFLGHDGGILGYATAMFYLPKAKATIVVESNSDNVSAQSALWTFIGIASYLYPEQFPKGL